MEVWFLLLFLVGGESVPVWVAGKDHVLALLFHTVSSLTIFRKIKHSAGSRWNS